MKKIISLLLLTVSFFATAQDKMLLEERAKKTMLHTVNGEYDKLLDYTYPKVFTIVPREQLAAMFKEALKGEGFTAQVVKSPPNFKFGEIKKIDNSYYSMIEHDLSMNMVFDEPIPDDELELTLSTFKAGMETNDITYDKPTKTLKIKKRSKMLAIADESTKNEWTYINNDGGPLMGMLIPEKHLTALGLKK